MRLVLKAHHRVLKKYPVFDEIMAQYNQKILAWMPVDSQQMVTKFPAHNLEDLKGKKIASGGPLIPWLQALGCAGIQSRLNEGYTCLQTGVYQGWATSANPIVGFKLYEPAPYFTVVDFGAFLAGTITINLKVWSQLPPEVQAIMEQVGLEYETRLADLTQKQLDRRMGVMKKAGVEIYELPAAEKARWAKILSQAGVAVKSAQQADEKGLPGTGILRSYYEALEAEGYRFPHRPEF